MSWHPFIWQIGKNWKENLKDGYQFGDITKGWFGFRNDYDTEIDTVTSSLFNQVNSQARDEFLADREHTEQREDTSYQRAVSDMRSAGLNPYTISAAPVNSSASSVGENTIQSKLQMLGYVLDLSNLDAKNRSITNNLIGNILKAIM